MSSDVLPDLLHTVDNHQDGNVVAESVIQNATPTGAPQTQAKVPGKLYQRQIQSNLTSEDVYEYGVPNYTVGQQANFLSSELFFQDTKKSLDNHDYKNFEETISGLILQVELWRRKHLDLKKAYQERAQNEEEMFISLEQRMRILLQENAQTSSELRVKLSTNEKYRLKVQQLEETVHQLQQYQAEVQIMEHLNQSRLKELDDWRAKYVELEHSVMQFRGLEIQLIEYEGRIGSLEKEVDTWRSKSESLQEEKLAIEKQLQRSNSTINDFNLDSTTRSQLSNAECIANQNEQLRDQLAQLLATLDESRRQSVALEGQVHDLQGQVQDESNLNNLITAELQRSQQTLADQESQMNDLRTNIMNLEVELREVSLLEAKFERQEDIHVLLTKDGVKLRHEINGLQDTLHGLRGIEQQYVDFKKENVFLLSEVDRYKDLLRGKAQELDSIRVKNGKLELQNCELKHEVKLFNKLSMDLRHVTEDYDELQKQLPLKERRLQEVTSELERQKSMIADLRIFESDVKRLRAVQTQRDNEVQDLRRQVTQLTVKNKDLQAVVTEHQELQARFEKLAAEKQQLTESVRNHVDANNRLLVVVGKLELQVSQATIVAKELSNIRTKNETLSKEVEIWRVKNTKLQLETDALKKAVDTAEGKVSFVNRELSKTNELYETVKRHHADSRQKANQSEQEAKENKQALLDLGVKMTAVTTERDKLQQQVNSLSKSVETLQLRVQLLLSQQGEQRRQSESDKLVLREETIKSNSLVDRFTKQCSDWKERYMKSEQVVNDLQNVEVRLKDQLKRNAEQEKEVVRLNDELATSQLDCTRLQQTLAQARFDLQHLQNVNDDLLRVKSQLTARGKELVLAQSTIPKLEQTIEDVKALRPIDQNAIANLESDLQRVNQWYQAKVRDNEELRNRCNALESRVIDIALLEKRVPSLEETIKTLRDEASRLTAQLSDRIDQHEYLRQQVSNYQMDLLTYAILKSSHSKLQRVHTSNEKELETTRSKLNRTIESLETTTQAKNEIEQAHFKSLMTIDQLSIRTSRQEHLINDLQAAIVEKDRLLDQSAISSSKLQSLLKQVGAQEGEIASLTEQLRKKQLEETKWRVTANQLLKQLSYLDPLQQQCLELNEVVHKDQEQFDSWRSKYSDVSEARTRESDTWSEKCDHLEKELAEQVEKNLEVAELRNLVQALKTQVRDLVQQLNDAMEDNSELKLIKEDLEIRVTGFNLLNQECLKLRGDLSNSNAQIDELKIRLSRSEAYAEELRSFKEGLENRIAMLASEIERLKHMLDKKNDEIENLRQTVQRQEQTIVELSPLEGNNRRLEEDLGKLKDESEAWKQQAAHQETVANEAIRAREGLENKIALLSSEIERQRVKCDNRASEIELQRLQIQELQQSLVDAQQLSGVVEELQSRVTSLVSERDQLVDLHNNKVKELTETRQRLATLEQEQLNGRLLDLKLKESDAIIKSRDAEIELYEKKYVALQGVINDLEKNRTELENKVALLSSEIERVNRKLQNQVNDNGQLQNHVQVLSADVNRLTTQSNTFIAENIQLRLNNPQPPTPEAAPVLNANVNTRRFSAATIRNPNWK